MSSPLISVVVPTLNEEKSLPVFFKSMKRCKLEDYEVIIVDKLSPDRTAEVAEENGARVLSRNLSLGDARTAGLKAAKGRIVASLDADSILCDGWLDIVEKNFETIEGLHALGGPSYYGNPLYDILSVATQFQNHFLPFTGFAFIPGNNSAFDRRNLLRLGGWNGKYQEEVDLSLRLYESKAKMFFDWNLKLKLSDRRFKQVGFAPTVFQWVKDNVDIVMRKERDRGDYSAWRKEKRK
jgi:glycosyltransferase involved in cell wall biosynthesis